MGQITDELKRYIDVNLWSEVVVRSEMNVSVSFQAVKALEQGSLSETSCLWQMKLVLELCESSMLQQRLRDTHKQARGLLLSSEFLPVMKSLADQALDHWLCGEKAK